jgi:hypothetical protein
MAGVSRINHMLTRPRDTSYVVYVPVLWSGTHTSRSSSCILLAVFCYNCMYREASMVNIRKKGLNRSYGVASERWADCCPVGTFVGDV